MTNRAAVRAAAISDTHFLEQQEIFRYIAVMIRLLCIAHALEQHLFSANGRHPPSLWMQTQHRIPPKAKMSRFSILLFVLCHTSSSKNPHPNAASMDVRVMESRILTLRPFLALQM